MINSTKSGAALSRRQGLSRVSLRSTRATAPAPRQRGRVLDEHPTSDAEIVREWRNDVTGLALERDLTRLQAGGSLLERPARHSVGCHERQIGNREPWEKPCERRRRDQLHAAAVKRKGRSELIEAPVTVKEALEAASRLLHVGLRDHDVEETDRAVRVGEPARLPTRPPGQGRQSLD